MIKRNISSKHETGGSQSYICYQSVSEEKEKETAGENQRGFCSTLEMHFLSGKRFCAFSLAN